MSTEFVAFSTPAEGTARDDKDPELSPSDGDTPRKRRKKKVKAGKGQALDESGEMNESKTDNRKRRSSATGLTDVALYWYDVMTRYGGIDSNSASDYAQHFAEQRLPFPSPDAKAYLTHELLQGLGVASPGDRCRIMLACCRMPELKHREEGENEEAGQKEVEHAVLTLDDAEHASYETDTVKVIMRQYAPADGSYLWIDLIGKDLPDPNEEKTEEEKEKEKQQQKPESKSVAIPITGGQSPGGTQSSSTGTHAPEGGAQPTGSQGSADTPKYEWDICYEEIVGILSKAEGGFPRVRDSTNEGGEGKSSAVFLASAAASDEGAAVLDELLATKLPLPQLRIGRNQPSKCAFVLRVCTLDVEEEDDTMRSLTNRWTIYVDAANHIVVTIHRVDSIALATLRDALPNGVIPAGIGFKEFLAKIIERFVVEYEKALDAAEEWLDACEAGMLSSSAQLSSTSDDLLTSLFHLQRRASVYDRMVILSRNLLQKEVSRHLDLGQELESLESRFQHLQEKTVDLGSRAQNLLEIHLSLTGYHTNELMKMLTKFSMFFTPITFLAGVWGMNFDNMPELRLEWGYYGALGLMLLIALAILGWFRWAGI